MAKVKFNYYSTKQTFDSIAASELVGTVSFVADVKKLYLGKDEYCLGDTTHILNTIKNSSDVKDLWSQVNSNKSKISTLETKVTQQANALASLDLSLYKVVTSLPSSGINADKIYLVKSTKTETKNEYDEWVYVNSKWEKIGSFRSTVDLTPYQKISDADSKYATKTELSTAKSALEKKNTSQDTEINALKSGKLDKTTASSTYATQTALNTEKGRITTEISDRKSEISRIEKKIGTSIAAAELVWGGDGIA